MAKDYEGDYQFGMATQFDKPFRGLSERIKSEPLRPIVSAYARNMERVTSLAAVPMDLIYWTSVISGAASPSPFQTGIPLDDLERSGDRALDEKYAHRMQMVFMRRAALGDEQAANEAWGSSTRFLKFLIRPQQAQKVEYLTDGLESVLLAMLLNSYAAFEAMATDTWVLAVNSSTRLASDIVNNKHRKKGETNKSRSETDTERVIPLMTLAEYQFNLSERMGDLIKKRKFMDFNSLDGLRRAYQSAFGSTAEAIFERQEKFQLAEKTRHLIAHRSGLVDEIYSRFVSKWPDFGNAEVGKYLFLDGVQVSELIGACVSVSIDLITLVDNYLAEENPLSSPAI